MAIVEKGFAAPAWLKGRLPSRKVLWMTAAISFVVLAVLTPGLVRWLELGEPWQSMSIWFAGGVAVLARLGFWLHDLPNRKAREEAAKLKLRG